MKVIALSQMYNESVLSHKTLQWLYPLVDQIIVTEGNLSPWNNFPDRSSDDTRFLLESFKILYDTENKIEIYDAVKRNPNNREDGEGNNKNFMLNICGVEPGDLLYIADADEFYTPDRFINIVDKFRNNDKIEHAPVEEYQFAYNLQLAFDAEHNGRFMRYVNGAKFGTTNHFIYPDGIDITKNYKHLITREESQMCHLCWYKRPELIRNKVISFNRPSFTQWYNNVYLVYPENPELAYQNNSRIPPYFGTKYAEGQHEPLKSFNGNLPDVLNGMTHDWTGYIIDNKNQLKI